MAVRLLADAREVADQRMAFRTLVAARDDSVPAKRRAPDNN